MRGGDALPARRPGNCTIGSTAAELFRMPQFSYRARNAQGGLVEGVLDCPDRAVAIRQIEQLHYMPVRIELVGGAPAPAGNCADNLRSTCGTDAEAENPA